MWQLKGSNTKVHENEQNKQINTERAEFLKRKGELQPLLLYRDPNFFGGKIEYQ